MSSILKALQRLEEETSDSGKEAQESPKNSPSKQVRAEFLKSFFNAFGKVTACLLSFIAIFWLVKNFNMDENKHPLSEETVLSTAEKSPSDIPEQNQVIRANRGDISVTPEKDPLQTIVDDEEPAAIAPKKFETTETLPVQPEEREAPPIQPAMTAHADDKNQDTPPEIEKITDSSWLTLQAISWSKDPHRRIAVINNKIVKQGSSVDRGTIALIDEDYVIIESENKEWLLQFGTK
ncbi:MAG: hypothetical protein KJ737_00990 [Proteobacteria bacterium]|nr:hypothetical protein [Pseudomonadota bacterium]